ncbi:hypothetical protein GYMLUDRAFT_239572 [Collybiopsis luxurians FD-317 M1]|nr:hypothetical protein GYMLUDRAFT_239572 [Collybiopsis luxurians FD-317 M1]
MFLLFCIHTLVPQFVLLGLSQSIQPRSIPLAVQSPYLQAYLSRPLMAAGYYTWPNFWTMNHILGWARLLRVDGALYIWLGEPAVEVPNNETISIATFNYYQVTPTRTILNLSAGNMTMNVTFLSPIEVGVAFAWSHPRFLFFGIRTQPDDPVLQSFPFTYIYFEASSMDGSPHLLQIYQDISGEWLSSDITNIMMWNTTTSNSIIYHEGQCSPVQYMTEINNMAEDGVVYFVTNTSQGSGVTYQTGKDTVLRSAFFNNRELANVQDISYRAINDRWPVLAFSHDLGIITSTSSPVDRIPYFLTKYPDVPTAISNFMNDASNTLQCATALDNKILSDAQGISSNYADLVSLAS